MAVRSNKQLIEAWYKAKKPDDWHYEEAKSMHMRNGVLYSYHDNYRLACHAWSGKEYALVMLQGTERSATTRKHLALLNKFWWSDDNDARTAVPVICVPHNFMVASNAGDVTARHASIEKHFLSSLEYPVTAIQEGRIRHVHDYRRWALSTVTEAIKYYKFFGFGLPDSILQKRQFLMSPAVVRRAEETEAAEAEKWAKAGPLRTIRAYAGTNSGLAVRVIGECARHNVKRDLHLPSEVLLALVEEFDLK